MNRREVICGMATGGVVGLSGCVSDLPLIGDDTPKEPEGPVEVATFYFQTDEIDRVITVVHPESERYEFLSGQTGETVPYDVLDTMVRKKKRGRSVVSLAYKDGSCDPERRDCQRYVVDVILRKHEGGWKLWAIEEVSGFPPPPTPVDTDTSPTGSESS